MLSFFADPDILKEPQRIQGEMKWTLPLLERQQDTLDQRRAAYRAKSRENVEAYLQMVPLFEEAEKYLEKLSVSYSPGLFCTDIANSALAAGIQGEKSQLSCDLATLCALSNSGSAATTNRISKENVLLKNKITKLKGWLYLQECLHTTIDVILTYAIAEIEACALAANALLLLPVTSYVPAPTPKPFTRLLATLYQSPPERPSIIINSAQFDTLSNLADDKIERTITLVNHQPKLFDLEKLNAYLELSDTEFQLIIQTGISLETLRTLDSNEIKTLLKSRNALSENNARFNKNVSFDYNAHFFKNDISLLKNNGIHILMNLLFQLDMPAQQSIEILRNLSQEQRELLETLHADRNQVDNALDALKAILKNMTIDQINTYLKLKKIYPDCTFVVLENNPCIINDHCFRFLERHGGHLRYDFHQILPLLPKIESEVIIALTSCSEKAWLRYPYFFLKFFSDHPAHQTKEHCQSLDKLLPIAVRSMTELPSNQQYKQIIDDLLCEYKQIRPSLDSEEQRNSLDLSLVLVHKVLSADHPNKRAPLENLNRYIDRTAIVRESPLMRHCGLLLIFVGLVVAALGSIALASPLAVAASTIAGCTSILTGATLFYQGIETTTRHKELNAFYHQAAKCT